MKKIIFLLTLFYLMMSMGFCGDWPGFAGVWMYSDYSIAAENMTVYEISPDSFYITVSISGTDDETVELEILDYNENANHIKTKVLYAPEEGQVFEITEGDILYWTYNDAEEGVMFFDYSKEGYPQKAETGPFESSDYNEGDQEWSEFTGTWYWVNEEGNSAEVFVFSNTHEASDFAVLEVYAESSQKGAENTGYVLFEIPSFNEGADTVRLTCLDSNGSLSGFKTGAKWYLAYYIYDDKAYFELSQSGYPEKPSYGPYFKITGEM